MKYIFTILMLLAVIYTHAATFTVTNTNDSGVGSLRTAISSANTGAGNIVAFNIPTSDPGYNASTGVFTIQVLSLLPAIQNMNIVVDGTTQTTNVGNTNPDGPEICIRGNGVLEYGICFPTSGNSVKGISFNGFQIGVLIYRAVAMINCNNNVVDGCYFGVNYNGTAADPNDIGVAIYDNATSNTVKNCLLSGNTYAGVGIRKANNNFVENNIIGCDKTISYRIPNYYGVGIDSASYTTVGGTMLKRNYISGNDYAGVAINTNQSHDNIIMSNYIGVNGTAASHTDSISNFYGIAINESYNNQIGGMQGQENLISGNSDAGIAILGQAATNNIIRSNLIGTNAAGSDSIPNGNGILISSSGSNVIGGAGAGNVISGNRLAGIAIAYYGASNNVIKGNFIGTDINGMVPVSNHTGIYLFSNANNNIVGGMMPGEANIISANYEMGVCMEAADSNVVVGNLIGPDISGTETFYLSGDTMIQGNGVYFNSNAAYNVADRNIISGNRVYGLIYYGNAPYNICSNNYIGTDVTGNIALPNTTGICVDGGANHSVINQNVLSGNLAYGIFIVTTGTYYNELWGNKIGTNAAGTAAVPNQIGLILGGGTKYNIIGGTDPAHRNLISGNLFNGIEVADSSTMYNEIIGNYIGTDITGDNAIPNLNGIGFATRPSRNNIENNLISGNGYLGIILYERSDSNTVYSNLIGTNAAGNSPLGNGAGGIAIVNSNDNIIGEPGRGNVIAYNDTIGLGIADDLSMRNTFSANHIYANGMMDIDIFPYGVNANDAGDGDTGSNELMNFPEVTLVDYDWGMGILTVTGTIDHYYPDGIRVEVFMSDNGNFLAHGGATQYLGYAMADANGDWSFAGPGANPGGMITTLATDQDGNTSEFSQNYDITVAVNTQEMATQFKVYPNPASDFAIISGLENQPVTITLVSSDGREWRINTTPAENGRIKINLSGFSSGLYCIKAGDKTARLVIK